MSCGNNTNSCECTTPVPPTSATGVKISQLDSLYPLSGNDLFVVVDVSENKTKNVDYDTVIYYDSSGTSLSANTFPDAINELNIKLDSLSGASSIHNDLQGLQGGTSGEYYHLTNDEYDVVVTISNGDGLVPPGGNINQVLVKTSTIDYDYEWMDNTGSGIGDTPNNGLTYIREYGNWVGFDQTSKADTSALDNYTTTADFESHVLDLDIHYDMSAIDHTLIQNIGNYTHHQIDTHIDDGTIHYPMSAIDAYTEAETDSLLAFKADTSAVLLKNGSVWLDNTYNPASSAVGDQGIATKGFVLSALDSEADINTVSFTFAGGVNNAVIMEKHSAYNQRSGFKVPSSDYKITIIGLNVFASSSYHDGVNSHDASIRLSEFSANNPTLYGFGSGNEVYNNPALFNGVTQSGTLYGFADNDNDFSTPVVLTPDMILYCELHPNFWVFSDLEVSLIYTIEKV